MQTEWTYLIHFSKPISDRHTCQHYAGSAIDIGMRFVDHVMGRGARLTQVAVERGIHFEIVRVWPGGRAFERQLKNQKNLRRYCPICAAKQRHRTTGQMPFVFDLIPGCDQDVDFY